MKLLGKKMRVMWNWNPVSM